MHARIILAAATLAVVAACSRPAPEPVADPEPVGQGVADLVVGAGFEDATSIASDIEVHRPAPEGIVEPPPGPTPPVVHAAAPAARAPAAPAPDEQVGGHADHIATAAEPTGIARTEADRGGEDTDAAGAAPLPGAGGGKPRPVMNEGPIRDPQSRGGIVIIRGGDTSVYDDCAVHPRAPATSHPPVVAVEPAGGVGVLINDRGPPGGTIAANRPPPNPGGELHPAGNRVRDRPLGGSRITGGARSGGILPRPGGIR
ncbi:hypothetical protein BH23GEM9_BH23GEM9_35350 [soil metagenome]